MPVEPPSNDFDLVLASESPRRRLLLERAGYRFEVEPSRIVEAEPTPGTRVADYVADLAWRKATEVARRRGSGLILGADTACEVEGEILNKPIDRDDAERMIRLQEGRDTQVVTGLCLRRGDRTEWLGLVETSIVRFRALGDPERSAFLDSGRWRGKAGAYGLQDDDPWVSLVSGSWSNVVGLPIKRLAEILASYQALTQAETPRIIPGNDGPSRLAL